ncbi:MAG TPA: hypothetical protein VMR28_00615 [Candidatus Saccharimonadales bacterium]|nr:hypothetical protein [Candidatus Saccharimonadales bacterium]
MAIKYEQTFEVNALDGTPPDTWVEAIASSAADQLTVGDILEEHAIETEREALVQAALTLNEKRRLHQPRYDAAAFEDRLGKFLAKSPKRPTDIFLTPHITDMIQDPELKARYLYRQMGGDHSEEGRQDQQLSGGYWIPTGSKEVEWVTNMRFELAEYPVAGIIDEVSDERTRILQASVSVVMDHVQQRLATVNEYVSLTA